MLFLRVGWGSLTLHTTYCKTAVTLSNRLILLCALMLYHCSVTYIEVNNVQERKDIYNVVGTIYGAVEPGIVSLCVLND